VVLNVWTLGLPSTKSHRYLEKPRAFLHDLQIGFCAVDRAFDLGAVADDAGIVHQRVDLLGIVARNLLRDEIVEGFAKVLALAQDRDPGKAGLKTIEDQLSYSARSSYSGTPQSVSCDRPCRKDLRPATGTGSCRRHAGVRLCSEDFAHATVCFGGVRTSFGSVRRIASPPADSVRPASSASATRSVRTSAMPWPPAVGTHGADRFVAGENGGARLWREIFQRDPHGAGWRAVPRCCIRDTTSWPTVTTFFEIDAVQPVHIGLVRKRIAVHEIEPAARHAIGDAMDLIGGFITKVGAAEIGDLLLEVFGNEDAPAQRFVAWVGETKDRASSKARRPTPRARRGCRTGSPPRPWRARL